MVCGHIAGDRYRLIRYLGQRRCIFDGASASLGYSGVYTNPRETWTLKYGVRKVFWFTARAPYIMRSTPKSTGVLTCPRAAHTSRALIEGYHLSRDDLLRVLSVELVAHLSWLPTPSPVYSSAYPYYRRPYHPYVQKPRFRCTFCVIPTL